jgi:hypothetical protein
MMMYVINGSRFTPEMLEVNSTKEELKMDAISYGLKGISKCNKQQLAVKILEHLVKQDGNYMSPMDEFERM